MRESLNQQVASPSSPNRTEESAGRVGSQELAYDSKAFFESFYGATMRGRPTDRMTIGAVTEMEARFHYNCVENAIIQAVARRNPPPHGSMVHAWQILQRRCHLRLMDLGSGTGHWIDYMIDVHHVAEAVGVEITQTMSRFLRGKYSDRSDVTILETDIAQPSFHADMIGGPVDYVTAIGIMFHIVEDQSWIQALHNIAAVMKPGGLAFVGGEFGTETRNKQFHKTDSFRGWKEHDQSEPGPLLVNKRVRSLAAWDDLAHSCGLRIVDLVRTQRDPLLTNPENDILVLKPVR